MCSKCCDLILKPVTIGARDQDYKKTGRTGRGLDKKRSKKSREAGNREKMSDGYSDVGAGEERDIDFGDMTDDGEVELNLPPGG